MSETNLKRTYQWQLRSFIAIGFLAFFGLFRGEDMATAIQLRQFEGQIIPKVVFSLSLIFVTLVLDGIVSADIKARLVYWRFRNPLPGCRAFNKHGPADPRVDMMSLERMYGPLPETENEQNQLWYRLFKTVEDRPSVSQAHQESLLKRDLASISFVSVFIFAILGLVFWIGMLSWGILVMVLILLFLAFRKVAANSGRRFVTTVLAEVTASIN